MDARFGRGHKQSMKTGFILQESLISHNAHVTGIQVINQSYSVMGRQEILHLLGHGRDAINHQPLQYQVKCKSLHLLGHRKQEVGFLRYHPDLTILKEHLAATTL